MQKERTHVLLVEDEEGHIRLMLKSFDAFADRFRITLAHNLADARSSIKEKTPDLLILDYNLPDGKGLELLKEHQEMPLFPVIVLTGFGDEKLAVEALKLGARDYVVKSAVRLRDIPNIADRALHEWKAIVLQKQTEEALRESEAKNKAILSAMPDLMFRLSKNGEHLDFYASASNELYLDPKEFLGKSVADVLPPEIGEKYLYYISKTLDTGKMQVFEYQLDFPGGPRDFESRMVVSGTNETLTIVRDITMRKQSELALQRSEEKYSTLVEQGNDIIVIVQDNIIKFANKRLTEIIGFTKEELIGKNGTDIVAEEYRGLVLERASKRLAGKDVPSLYEIEIVTADGKTVPVEMNVSIIDYEDSPAIMIIMRDIAKRKKAEDALKAITQTFAAHTGKELFNRVSEHLTKTLDVDYAFVGELLEEGNRVRVIGGSANGSPMESFEYDLADTPCANVMGQSPCAYLSGVQELFPKDRLLVEMGIEGYFGTPLFDSKGKPVGIIVLLHTRPIENQELAENLFKIFSERISAELERMKAQDALNVSQQRLELAHEAAGMGMFDWDIINNLAVCNERYFKLFGLETQDRILSEEDWLTMVHPDDRERAQKEVKDTLENRARYNTEYRVVWPDTSVKWVSSKAKVFYDDDGSPYRMIGVMTDITARKNAEIELYESEERFKRLSDAAFEGIAISEGGLIIDANKQMASMLGYELNELIGIEVWKFVASEDRTLVAEKIKAQINTPYEHRALCKDGSVITVEVCGQTTSYKGKNVRLTAIRDITERKKLEAQLFQSQKMESIGTLAGGIAHDFNNILNAIFGFTYLAKMKVPEGSDAADKLDSLTKAANRATDLVRQILLFSRSGSEELKPTLVTPVIKEALKLLRASIPTTVEMQENIAPTGHIMADPVQIHQILMNLCTNAYHAMQETGGVLGIDLQEVQITADFASTFVDLKPGPYIRLTVSDTGHGMESSIKDRIFEPYFTTKEKGKGTGLGLSVVHGIVKNYGGEITITSELSRGTTFQVYMPVIQKKEEQVEIADETILNGTGSVLFVDDEKSTVLISTEILESLGYKVTGQTDSQEALKLFREKPDEFDVVITDMTMPKMTGIKLAEEMIGIRPDIPVILCTGFSEGINEEMVKQKGIREFLMKPVAPVNIAKAIHTVLGKSHPEPNNPGREVT